MVDFNRFDKGVIGKKLPADTTLNCMRKADLIKLLHLAEDNHRVLAEAYKIAVGNSKCKTCPLHLDSRRVAEIKADAIDEILDLAVDVDMDSSLIYIRLDRDDFENPNCRYKADLKEWLRKQLKEKK